jgi:hypothetical protein
MPAAVSTVVSLRAFRFFAVYENGITIFRFFTSEAQRRGGNAKEIKTEP